jgi:hypothetical protein
MSNIKIFTSTPNFPRHKMITFSILLPYLHIIPEIIEFGRNYIAIPILPGYRGISVFESQRANEQKDVFWNAQCSD